MQYGGLGWAGLLSGLVLGCSHGGDDTSSTQVVVTGLVRSPGGAALASSARSGPRTVAGDGTQRAEFPGLLPVPDGTQVELVALDAAGEPREVLARSTTLAGAFALVLIEPGAADSLRELAVVAGSGATRMRAWIAGTTADVDPFAEAAFDHAVAQGPLVNLSDEERLDLVGGVELVVRADGLEPGADVAETVASFKAAALSRPGYVAFAAAAAGAPGTTSTGPGDLGEFFPLRIDDVHGYAAEKSRGGRADYRVALESQNLGTTGDLWTLRRTDVLTPSTSRTGLRLDDRALVRESTDDGLELFPDAPLRLLAFPLRPGKSWVEVDIADTRFREPVDFDGLEERADLFVVRTVAGFEELVVADETFPHCVRIDVEGTVAVHASVSGAVLDAVLEGREWYAPGIGLVKRERTVRGNFYFGDVRVDEELTARRLGGAGRGILPPHPLTELGAPLSCVLRPGAATDGERSLVVTIVEDETTRRLTGYLLSPQGELERTIALRELPLSLDCPNMRVTAAFDGTNYLVPFVENFRIVCLRISPAGDLLDPTPLPLSVPEQEGGFGPVIASDGTNSLVVWTRYTLSFPPEIHAALVAGDGTVLDRFQYMDGELNFHPQLAFGGGQYVLGWVHTFGNTVAVARITTAGELLDPAGIGLRAGLDYSSAEVALGFDGEQWLVVFSQEPQPNGPTQNLVARRLRSDGTLVDPLDQSPLVISTIPFNKYAPSVLFDGTAWQVAWTRHYSVPGAVHLARLSRDGVLLDGPSDSPSQTLLGPTEPSTPYHLVETLLVPGPDHSNLLWVLSPRSMEANARLHNSRIYARP